MSLAQFQIYSAEAANIEEMAKATEDYEENVLKTAAGWQL
jgi:hypothetical protein